MDWLATILNVLGLVILPTNPRVALVVYSIANISLFVWAVRGKKSVAIATSQVVFLALNVRAFIIWSMP